MSSAWLLPEHIADVLPAQARRIEELRRQLLDMARSYGCELVIPPLLWGTLTLVRRRLALGELVERARQSWRRR